MGGCCLTLTTGRRRTESKDVIRLAWKTARKIVIGVVGMTVLLFGIALIVLPGPAFVVIPIGLGILALEFAWAKRLLERVKNRVQAAKDSLVGSSSPPPQ